MMDIPLSSKSWNSISRVSAAVTGEKCVYGEALLNLIMYISEWRREGEGGSDREREGHREGGSDRERGRTWREGGNR
jgi:hypothetical protein